MNREGHRELVLLLFVTLIMPAVAQQENCPIQIQKIELRSRVAPTLVCVPGRGCSNPIGNANQETTIRIRYKNLSSKAIDSARAIVELSLLGPSGTFVAHGSQAIVLDSLPAGQKRSTSLTGFSAIPTRVRLTLVSFADGSSWSPIDPSSCGYPQKHRSVQVGLPIPAK